MLIGLWGYWHLIRKESFKKAFSTTQPRPSIHKRFGMGNGQDSSFILLMKARLKAYQSLVLKWHLNPYRHYTWVGVKINYILNKTYDLTKLKFNINMIYLIKG